MTLNNNRQKINDCLGNPIEIGIAVTWRITDTAKAVFNVDTTGDGIADEGSLRGSSETVANRIKEEIQCQVNEAGIEIIDARKMIVDGAVGMVEMALEHLNENSIVELDEERKAAMVSNLLVVLCRSHDAQPVANSGSLY